MAIRSDRLLNPHLHRGFSLIELMMAVVIIGILAAIAIPSYREYIVRANRDAAKAVLLEIVSRQEQYAATNRAYSTDITGDTGLRVSIPAEIADKYDFAVALTSWTYAAGGVDTTMSGFTATAAPVAGSMQENDGTLSINQFGLKTRDVGGTVANW